MLGWFVRRLSCVVSVVELRSLVTDSLLASCERSWAALW